MKPAFLFITCLCFYLRGITQIHEERFVKIGGIEQWITIHGEDIKKPVILFLHGGPGSVMSPYQFVMKDWEKEFIIVHWDQRGAGRTFGRNAPADVTEDYWIENPLKIDQYVNDGIELSAYLLKHLGKEKIILSATSWGSVIGAYMSLKRPELFHAYIGHSQVVNALDGLEQAYLKTEQLAKERNDKEVIQLLTTIGKPPYESARDAGVLLRIIKQYEKQKAITAPESWWIRSASYNTEADDKYRNDGDDYSFLHYVGHKKMGIEPMMKEVDFMKEKLVYAIPVYFIQGEHDILTPKEVSKAYFDKLTAPIKKYYLVPGAAHGFNQGILDQQYRILKEIASTL